MVTGVKRPKEPPEADIDCALDGPTAAVKGPMAYARSTAWQPNSCRR